MQDLEQEIKEMCDLVDEFAKCHISTDTPMFVFQQEMIRHCRKYREAKARDDKEREEMWKNPEAYIPGSKL